MALGKSFLQDKPLIFADSVSLIRADQRTEGSVYSRLMETTLGAIRGRTVQLFPASATNDQRPFPTSKSPNVRKRFTLEHLTEPPPAKKNVA